MITLENEGSNIILYGRKGKLLYAQKVEDFKPYFYYEDTNGKYTSISGKKLSKKVVLHPKVVRGIRDNYIHHEADIVYTNRYIIDRIDKLEKEQIRICYIDIELARTEKGYEHVSKANNPILMIGCYDSFDREKKQFCIGKTHKDEKQMLLDFITYIQKTNPDMFVAWSGDRFDFPYIVNRIKKLRINVNSLGRGGRCYTIELPASIRSFRTKIFGRICFDLMEAYKKINSNEGRESWSLDYISKYEGVGEKEKYKGELDDLHKNDIEKFIKYNDKDVELLVLLNEKLMLVDFFDEVRRLCYCRFEDVFMNTKMADCLCLKTVKGKYVLPSSHPHKRVKFEGAFVHDSEAKLHKNIAVMDMKSLYPSIMIGFNTSYETYLDKKEPGCISIDNKFNYKKEIGLIPSIVKPLLQKRNEVKAKMEGFDKESREYKSLWMQQIALKVIANSFYGVMGCPHFRLFKIDVAQTITYTAQKVIKEVHHWFELAGFKIIYGDTDSVFIEMGDKTIEDMTQLNKDINIYFRKYFLQYNINENIFKLEFEKIYKAVLFKRKADGTGAKKRYAGRIMWEDGEYVNKFSIVGFESKRSDSPQIGRDFLKRILEMICDETSKNEIDEYIEEFKNKIRSEFTPEQIGLPIGITKPLHKYKNQIHARAARLANEKHNAQIHGGDKVKYLYVKGADNVIAFKSDGWMWEGYEIDYDMMIRRIIDLKIGPLYDSLGWNYIFWEGHKKKKEKEVKFEDTLKQGELW